MAIRYGANGQPMPEKKPEALQEILEVNPNEDVASPVEATLVDEDEVSWDDLEDDLEEEEEEDEDL
jgi:hypothetical protein|tara:strand:- start:3369 stop:3566 length:198 start_codon:yes stop_codon:yes gene_type:complete